MTSLVTSFQGLIPTDFVLDRNGSCWHVTEPGAPNNRFEVSAGKSIAFSLDKKGGNVFPFFTGALVGMRAVNDAILVAIVNGEPYVIAIELKSSKVGDALKQIESGRLFTAWVRELLSCYAHWAGGRCKFFAVVSLKPRSQIRKGTTSRAAQLPDPTSSPNGCYPYFVLKNHPRVSVQDLVRRIHSTSGPCPAAV